jgi:hypothetical protein
LENGGALPLDSENVARSVSAPSPGEPVSSSGSAK